jgi:hypothetical protein
VDLPDSQGRPGRGCGLANGRTILSASSWRSPQRAAFRDVWQVSDAARQIREFAPVLASMARYLLKTE